MTRLIDDDDGIPLFTPAEVRVILSPLDDEEYLAMLLRSPTDDDDWRWSSDEAPLWCR